MRANALYFPNISVPNSQWTAKALLYWDTLAAIVPTEQLRHPERMTRFMRELLSEGLVRPIAPDQYLNLDGDFADGFMELVQFQHGRRFVEQRKGPMIETVDAEKIGLVHGEKLGRLGRLLVNAGLAAKREKYWYAVESTTADLYMTYLVTFLGTLPELDAAPVTNERSFARLLQPDMGKMPASLPHRDQVRDDVLRVLLPRPQSPLRIDKLLRFKCQHGDLLRRFRTMIEPEFTRIARLPAEDRAEATAAFHQQCQQKVAEIDEAVRLSFGSLVYGELIPLVGVGLGVYAATQNPTAAAWASTGAGVAERLYRLVSTIRGPQTIRNDPLAYVAHAQRTFGREQALHNRYENLWRS